MNSCTERLKNGYLTENPTFVMMLGYVSYTGCYNISDQRSWYGTYYNSSIDFIKCILSLYFSKVIPDKVRIPAFIVIVASFVRSFNYC